LEIKQKKKGRPKSIHYVNEQELRDEILISQTKAKNILDEITLHYDSKSLEATDENLDQIQKEFDLMIQNAKMKTHCTSRLGEIILLTVDRVATQHKFRNYTYLDDMKAEATFQSIRGIIKFNLDKVNDKGLKSSSFSYLTQIITNAFRQILNKEKKNRDIKDQAIEIALDMHRDLDVEFDSIKRKKEKQEISS